MLTEIRGYTDLRHIGTGGFGEVYVGRQEVINREVAIKVILPVHANHIDFIQRFKYEAELVARLEHPHIVPLYDYWRDPDGAFLVMRYIRGGNLADKLTTDGAFDIEWAGRLLEQISGALYIAHRNKIVHQDIKPANILLDEDGNAYLTDFGIARDIEGDVNLAEDENNTMHGSPKYISPEHLRRKEITHRSDIYSLGILMYEILTGRTPYESEEMLQLLQQHVRAPMPSLQEKNPDLPPELNQPIQQATVKDPLSRYESVLDFSNDFQMIIRQLKYPDSTATFGIAAGGMSADATGPITVFNPYKGLKAFQEADASDFYGREELVQNLMNRMVEFDPLQRFLAVVGPSGSGKSSVVRAGLIPAIRRGDLEGLPTLLITDMTPGNNPMRRLEGAILKVAHQATMELMNTLSKDDYDLNEMLAIALPEDAEMLLIIDQFEEVFTLVDNEKKRRGFLNLVYKALRAENSRLRLIVTMRADFLDRPLEYSGWGDLLSKRMELVAPMKPSELLDAIEKPAMVAGLVLEDGLAGLIVDDVSSQAGVLPLLQYTLSELYERRNGIELTQAAYQELGGIRGALAKRAEEIFQDLTEAQQEATRLFFPRLISFGLGRNSTRRRVMLGELYSMRTDTDAVREAVEEFGKRRLLTSDYDLVSRLPTIEVAHEALIRSWERLNRWLRENEDILRLQERLGAEVEQWKAADKDNSFLPSGMRLEQYKGLLDHEAIVLTKREQEFLDSALILEAENLVRERRRQKLFQSLTAAIFVFGIVSVILAFVANNLRIEAEDAQDAAVIARNEAIESEANAVIARDEALANAQTGRARELAVSSLLFAETYPDTAMLLGLESLAVADTFEGRNALMTSLLKVPSILGYFNGHDAFIRQIALSPDEVLLASGGADGRVIVWDKDTRDLVQTLEGHEIRINGLAFSPNGQYLVSADATGKLLVWDTETWVQFTILEIDENIAELRTIAFSVDGRWLVAGTSDGHIIVWNAGNFSQAQILEEHNGGTIYDIVFSPDNSLMVSGGDDGTLHYWDTETFSLLDIVVAHEGSWILTLAFSPDGTKLASGGLDRRVKLWDVESRSLLWRSASSHPERVTTLNFTRNGSFIIAGDLNATIVVWDTASGSARQVMNNISQTEVRDLIVHGSLLYVAGDSQSVYELSINFVPRFGKILARNSDELWSVAISPSGERTAFAGGTSGGGAPEDFAVYIWDAVINETIRLQITHTLTVTDVLFWDEQVISVGLDSRIIIWNDSSAEQILFASEGIISAAIHENILVVGLNNGQIELWDLSSDSEERIGLLEGHQTRVNDLAFSTDGTILVSGGRDMRLIIWDVESGEILHHLDNAHNDSIEAIAISPDGAMIASGSRDNNIILWDSVSGEKLGLPLSAHEGWVQALAFNADGSLLASGSVDSSIILWDVDTQRLLGLPFFGHSNLIYDLEFSTDGTFMVSSDSDGTVIRWEVNLDTWQERACSVANRSLTDAEQRDYDNEIFPLQFLCGGE